MNESIAIAIMNLPERNRTGTLKIWSEWFGKPMDNIHTCISCEAGTDHLVMYFNEGERLQVWNPSALPNDRAVLTIPNATRVRWEWFSYGREHTPENLMWLDYVREGGSIVKTSNVPRASNANGQAAAVELVA